MNDYFLRPLKRDDAERMLSWVKDANVTQFLRLDGANKTLEDMWKFIDEAANETRHLHRAITSENGQYYGTVSLKDIDHKKGEAEFAITLHPEAMGSGAAQTASWEILRIAFTQLRLNRVYLNVIERNIRAVRLYESLGFCYQYSTKIWFKGNVSENLRWYEIRPERIYDMKNVVDSRYAGNNNLTGGGGTKPGI